MIHHYLRILFWDVYDYFSKTWYKAHYRANYVDSRTPEERMSEPESVTTTTTGGEPIVVTPDTFKDFKLEVKVNVEKEEEQHPQSEWDGDLIKLIGITYTTPEEQLEFYDKLKAHITRLLHSRDEKLREEPRYSKYVAEELEAHHFYGDIETDEGGKYLCAIGTGNSDDPDGERVADYINYLAEIIATEVGYERFEKWREKNPLNKPHPRHIKPSNH